MSCNKCGKDKKIVNKHFKLCQECNNERLHGSKYGKQYTNLKSKNTPIRTAKKPKGRKSLFSGVKESEKSKDKTIELDEALYEEVFNNSNHKCEECSADLPDIFRNEDGKVVARYRYSHIIPKSIAPELRHSIDNINNLCLKCHIKWENGNKAEMKIFKKNYLKFSQFLSSWKTKT